MGRPTRVPSPSRRRTAPGGARGGFVTFRRRCARPRAPHFANPNRTRRGPRPSAGSRAPARGSGARRVAASRAPAHFARATNSRRRALLRVKAGRSSFRERPTRMGTPAGLVKVRPVHVDFFFFSTVCLGRRLDGHDGRALRRAPLQHLQRVVVRVDGVAGAALQTRGLADRTRAPRRRPTRAAAAALFEARVGLFLRGPEFRDNGSRRPRRRSPSPRPRSGWRRPRCGRGSKIRFARCPRLGVGGGFASLRRASALARLRRSAPSMAATSAVRRTSSGSTPSAAAPRATRDTQRRGGVATNARPPRRVREVMSSMSHMRRCACAGAVAK